MPFSYLFAGFLSALDIPKYTLYTIEMGIVFSEKSSSMLEYILFVLRQRKFHYVWLAVCSYNIQGVPAAIISVCSSVFWAILSL